MHTWINITTMIIIIVSITFLPTTALATEQSEDTITYLAFGDSLTEGLLENRLLSESGGYYEYLIEAFISKGYKVKAANYAKSGATSKEIIAQLHHLDSYPKGPDVVTVSMGLNDLRPYLYSLSDQSFQTDVANAHTVLNVFEENVEETQDDVRAIKKTFIELERNIVALQAFMDTAITLTEKDPLLSNNEDIHKWSTNVKEQSDTMDNTLISINSIIERVNFPEADIDRQSMRKLEKELTISFNQLTTINTQVGQILDTLTDKQIPVTLDDDHVLKMIKQAEKHIENIKQTIKTGKVDLRTSFASIEKVNKSYEKVPAAQSVIKKSIKVINNAFNHANQELSVVGTNIANFIEHTRETNPDVDIYIMGYYNTKPYTSGALHEKMISLVTALNDTIESTASTAGATFIPSFEAFDGRYEELLPNPNDIHPSQAGYAVLAEQFIMAMNSNYPTISQDTTLMERDDQAVIEEKEDNIATQINSSQEIKKTDNIWIKTFQNYNFFLLVIEITIMVLMVKKWLNRNRHSLGE